MYYSRLLEKNREIRSKFLRPIGNFLLRLKLTANRLTFLSFILGFAAAYFLFQNYFLFILFAALHLTTDGLDGVLARLTKPTLIGKYFDYLTDQTITLFLLIKVYLYLQDHYVILIISLFVFGQIIHLASKLQCPFISFRTGSLILLSFTPLFSLNQFLVVGYLIAGTISLFTLLLQFKHFLRKTD